MVVDVKSALLHGKTGRTVFVELPSRDAHRAHGCFVGKLEFAMYGTKGAPLIWQEEDKSKIEVLCFSSSVLQA